jgi:hypothetical protein
LAYARFEPSFGARTANDRADGVLAIASVSRDRSTNVVQLGLLVDVELNNDAHKVTCDVVSDLVVRTVVALDTSCPCGRPGTPSGRTRARRASLANPRSLETDG